MSCGRSLPCALRYQRRLMHEKIYCDTGETLQSYTIFRGSLQPCKARAWPTLYIRRTTIKELFIPSQFLVGVSKICLLFYSLFARIIGSILRTNYAWSCFRYALFLVSNPYVLPFVFPLTTSQSACRLCGIEVPRQ
jgi:hypothetical protein